MVATSAWVAWIAFFPISAVAEVIRVEIATVTPWLGGRSLGKAGSYEKLQGRVYFEVDPESSTGRRVTDIALAPHNDWESGRFRWPQRLHA